MTRNSFTSVFGVAALAVAGLYNQTAKAADGPSDPQIVGIVVTADNLDIEYGKIALAKSKNKAIRDFAQRMVTDHSAVQASVVSLAEKLGVSPEDSPTRTSLRDGGKGVFEKLNSLDGKEFDKYYIDNEVGYHKAVNDAMAAVLIPSAQNAELKQALLGAQPLFLKHGEHAQLAQSSWEKGGGKMDHMSKMSKVSK